MESKAYQSGSKGEVAHKAESDQNDLEPGPGLILKNHILVLLSRRGIGIQTIVDVRIGPLNRIVVVCGVSV